jgi:hypothetical protein
VPRCAIFWRYDGSAAGFARAQAAKADFLVEPVFTNAFKPAKFFDAQ